MLPPVGRHAATTRTRPPMPCTQRLRRSLAARAVGTRLGNRPLRMDALRLLHHRVRLRLDALPRVREGRESGRLSATTADDAKDGGGGRDDRRAHARACVPTASRWRRAADAGTARVDATPGLLAVHTTSLWRASGVVRQAAPKRANAHLCAAHSVRGLVRAHGFERVVRAAAAGADGSAAHRAGAARGDGALLRHRQGGSGEALHGVFV